MSGTRSTPWRVRNVTSDDLTGIRAVIEACGLFPSAMLDAMIGPYLAGNPTTELWVTVDDPTPVAVAYCAPERMTEGCWTVLLIAVHPARQGQGVGKAAMRTLETRLGACGERLLLVETSGLPAFSGPRAFYRRIGFHEEARIRDFYQAGEDKIVFRKSLALRIRPAVASDVEVLQALEVDAARSYGADPATRFCLNLPARDAGEHEAARSDGLALMAEVSGTAVGFLLALPKDGRAHLLELAVLPDRQGQGLGRALIAAFEAWAVGAGFSEVTLTTFRDVSWNAPFYERLGYRTIAVGADRGALSAVIDEERRAGFHKAPRVAMAKPLVAPR